MNRYCPHREKKIGGIVMTKLEQAIAYFEDAIRESDEIIAECSEALQKELMEQKKHFEIALEAMKEKQGRKDGCAYCVPDKNNTYLAKEFFSEQNRERVNVMFCAGHAFVIIKAEDGLERSMPTPIYYCPMCGRKLEWESEVE